MMFFPALHARNSSEVSAPTATTQQPFFYLKKKKESYEALSKLLVCVYQYVVTLAGYRSHTEECRLASFYAVYCARLKPQFFP